NSVNGNRLDIPGLTRPDAVAVDPVHHTAWVCDEPQSAVFQYQLDGSPAATHAVGPVVFPTSVAVSGFDGRIWVCDNQALKVLLFNPTGVLVASLATPRPSRVAIDSLTGNGWVTSLESGLLVRIRSDGGAVDTVRGLAGPIGVAVDGRRGAIWVADAVA